jgi:hypothetical protein
VQQSRLLIGNRRPVTDSAPTKQLQNQSMEVCKTLRDEEDEWGSLKWPSMPDRDTHTKIGIRVPNKYGLEFLVEESKEVVVMIGSMMAGAEGCEAVSMHQRQRVNSRLKSAPSVFCINVEGVAG